MVLLILKDLYLHIGLPKTGTTVLQKHTFPALNPQGIKYLGRKYTKPKSQREHEFRFNALTMRPKSFYREQYESVLKWLNINPDDPLANTEAALFSSEGILSRSFIPQYWTEADDWDVTTEVFAADPEDIVQKLKIINWTLQKNVNIRLKLLLCLRRQDQFLHSYYAFAPHRCNQLSGGKKFSDFVSHMLDSGYYVHGGHSLRYDKLISQLHKKFPKNNVKILLYESMNNHPKTYAQNLADFLNVSFKKIANTLGHKEKQKSNTQKGARKKFEGRTLFDYIYRTLADIKNNLFPNVRLNLGERLSLHQFRNKHSEIKLNDQIQKKIMTRFQDSNNNLAKLVPELDEQLRTYDYI